MLLAVGAGKFYVRVGRVSRSFRRWFAKWKVVEVESGQQWMPRGEVFATRKKKTALTLESQRGLKLDRQRKDFLSCCGGVWRAAESGQRKQLRPGRATTRWPVRVRR
jgi:hypothetical protein